MSLQGWQTMVCECGNRFFHQVFVLSWHENQGTSTKPDGWSCTGCGKRSDTAKMINVAKQKQLHNKIQELQEQL